MEVETAVEPIPLGDTVSVILPEDDLDADQRAEDEMMQYGLTVSTNSLQTTDDLDRPYISHSLPKTVAASPHAVPGSPLVRDFSFLKRRLAPQLEAQDDPLCRKLRTVLLMPFYFWPDIEQESPAAIASALMRREVKKNGKRLGLWEQTSLPDVSEFSLHFRQLLGNDGISSSIQRLRLTENARNWLFSKARLWADMKGEYAAKQCDWHNVHLVIFPHGCILSVTVDWMSEDVQENDFALSDLCDWLHIAKFRSIKVGVTRGWSFERRQVQNVEHAELEQRELGLEMFAALYGGSCVSMVSIANWLVKLPHESSSSIPKRVSRFEYSLHFTYCLVDERPDDVTQARLIHSVLRAQGPCPGNGGSGSSGSSGSSGANTGDELLFLRSNAAVGVSREGVFGLVWEREREGGFFTRFMGVYLVLLLHTLAERVTLEKLSYLEALYSQHLPLYEGGRRASREQIELARASIVSLTSLLVRYSSCMASGECGGRPEYGEFVNVLRNMHSIASLKKELGEEVQDMLVIVNRAWNEERRRGKKKEKLWEIRRDEISRQISRTRDTANVMSDVLSNSLLGVCFPIMFAINLFSMNLITLPRQFPWSWVLIIAGCFSGTMVIVFLTVFFYYRRSLLALKEEKIELVRERAERLRLAAASIDKDEEEREEEETNAFVEALAFKLGGTGAVLSSIDHLDDTDAQIPVRQHWSMDIQRKPHHRTKKK